MMAIMRLLDGAAGLSRSTHLAEDITRNRSGLSATSDGKASERTRNCGEGEKFLHVSSLSTAAAAALFVAVDNVLGSS